MKTKFWTLQPKMRRWQKAAVMTILIIFIGGGLLIGANAIKINTESTPLCPQRTEPDCIKDMPKPICPPQQRVPCPLDSATQGIFKEIKEFETCQF